MNKAQIQENQNLPMQTRSVSIPGHGLYLNKSGWVHQSLEQNSLTITYSNVNHITHKHQSVGATSEFWQVDQVSYLIFTMCLVTYASSKEYQKQNTKYVKIIP